MQWVNNRQTYGSLSIFMHWLMVLLFIVVYSSIELRGIFDKGTPERDLIKYVHFVTGLSIFSLVAIRLVLRWLQTTPEMIGDASSMANKAAKLVHYALYGLMIVMPILGLLLISAEGKQLIILGLEIPHLIGENHDLAEFFEEVHETIGNLGMFLIGGHAIAALAHHYLFGDNTLKRMLGKG